MIAVINNSFLKGKNTQEIYNNMSEVSRNDALKCTSMTKSANEFNMDSYGRKDNPVVKGLNKILLCNRLRLHMKL